MAEKDEEAVRQGSGPAREETGLKTESGFEAAAPHKLGLIAVVVLAAIVITIGLHGGTVADDEDPVAPPPERPVDHGRTGADVGDEPVIKPRQPAVPIEDDLKRVSSLTTYTVSSGDNLWKISRRYNCPIPSIRRLNGLESDDLNIGQKLP